MAYTAPVAGDWDTNDIFVAAKFATQVLDNITYLKTAADSRAFSVEVFSALSAVGTGDNKRIVGPAPAILNTYNLTNVISSVYGKSTGGVPTVSIQRGRSAAAGSAHAWVDMLSTNVTIDANEYSSITAATAMVVNTSNDDIATGDLFSINVDVAGTATTGLWVTMEFAK